jgi:hypothetical protein
MGEMKTEKRRLSGPLTCARRQDADCAHLHVCAGAEVTPVLPRKDRGYLGPQASVGKNNPATFDNLSKTDVYCKASLLAQLLRTKWQGGGGLKSVAERRGGQDKSGKSLKYFDSAAKTDVYYEAQLIAAKSSGKKPGF